MLIIRPFNQAKHSKNLNITSADLCKCYKQIVANWSQKGVGGKQMLEQMTKEDFPNQILVKSTTNKF